MTSLKSSNKLPSSRTFSAAEKWIFRSTGVGGLISPKNGNLRRQKMLSVCVDAIFNFAFLRLVSKREGQIQSKFDGWKFFNLAPHLA